MTAIIFLFLTAQQKVSVRFNRSSELGLKWLNFVVTCKSDAGISEYHVSKFDTFHDYFNKIVDESMSFRLNVNVNKELEVARDPIFKADEQGYVISEPFIIMNYCDLGKPIECKDGGFEIQDYMFLAQIEMSCTKITEAPKMMQLANKGIQNFNSMDDADEDIEEIEYEQFQARENAKLKKEESQKPKPASEEIKPKSEEKQPEPDEEDHDEHHDHPEEEDHHSIKLTIKILDKTLKKSII